MSIDRSPKRYLAETDVDFVARQNVQLMTEVWVLRDRLAVMEQLLVNAGLLEAEAVDRFNPDDAFLEKMEHERAAYAERVVAFPGDERTVETLKLRSGKVRHRLAGTDEASSGE